MRSALVRAVLRDIRLKYNGDDDDQRHRTKRLKDIQTLTRENEVIRKEIANLDLEQDGLLLSQKTEQLMTNEGEIERLQSEGQKAVIATLTYPRSGASTVVTVRTLDIPANGRPASLGDPGQFSQTGLFKEIIQGETELQVRITNHEKANSFWLFIRRVFGSIFGGVASKAIGGIPSLVVGSTATEVKNIVSDAIVGGQDSDKEKSEVVAESQPVALSITSTGALQVTNADGKAIRYKDGVLHLDLVTPDYIVLERDKEDRVTNTKYKVYMKKGESNGYVELGLTSEPTS